MNKDKITYLRHKQIDLGKWDQCIEKSYNGLVYGYSWFISGMAEKQWDAIVLNDYEAVFPLPWKSRFGIKYLYQPYFIQQLGIFSLLPLTTEQLWQMIDTVPKAFRYWEINLNSRNYFFRPDTELANRVTYKLDLNKSYPELYDNYKSDAKKNLARTFENHLETSNSLDMQTVVQFYRGAYGALNPHVGEEIYQKIEALGSEAVRRGKGILKGVTDAEGRLIAAALFLVSHHTAHYVLGAPNEKGKLLGATHVLIDSFIKEYSGRELVLDFEGSDIPSVAYFYSKFGSSPTHYYFLKRNRLPAWLKWLKK